VTCVFQSHRRNRAAFTLLEMMVAASLLVVIIFSLYQMFNYTQRAFRVGVTQVDVNEGGRAVMELVTRELEQTTTASLDDVVNLFISTNFSSPGFLLVTNPTDNSVSAFQLLDAYCLRRDRDDWRATGYFVAEITTNTSDLKLLSAGVGALFRYESSTNRLTTNQATRNWMFNGFANPGTNAGVQRIIDGVVHFRVNALDAAGRLLRSPYTALPADALNYLQPPATRPPLTQFFDTDDDLPAYLELEFAVVEPAVLEIIKARTEGLAAGPATTTRVQALLGSQASRVHVFRQRIAVRSVPR